MDDVEPITDELVQAESNAVAQATPVADLHAASPETTAMSEATSRIDEIINAWVASHIHNSPVAQATEAFNHLLTSLPALRDKLLGAL